MKRENPPLSAATCGATTKLSAVGALGFGVPSGGCAAVVEKGAQRYTSCFRRRSSEEAAEFVMGDGKGSMVALKAVQEAATAVPAAIGEAPMVHFVGCVDSGMGLLLLVGEVANTPLLDLAADALIPDPAINTEFSKRSRMRSKALEADGQRSWHNGHGHLFPDMLSNGSTMELFWA